MPTGRPIWYSVCGYHRYHRYLDAFHVPLNPARSDGRIGGGVPSKHDIRLGDVVVSQPFGKYGGVVQHDLGKIVTQGQMRRTGFLNAPPPLLLNAISRVRANHLQGRIDFTRYSAAFHGLPQFDRHAAGPDKLFEATYEHKRGETCESCTKVVIRPTRTGQEVLIHYGTIASGNQVIKDGATRDRISSELGDVLCFEMEGAGLMNSFPCLVIRGICDYADIHKNKKWQGYAAATAASFAKEVLSVIPMPSKFDFTTLSTAEGASFDSRDEEHNATCLENTRTELRCQIAEWADSEHGKCIFWLNGMAGTGKSTIARTVARSFKDNRQLGASFFFKRGEGDRGNATRFFTTIVTNLIMRIPDLAQHVENALRDEPDILDLQ
ncbi:hypothetical protein BP5796_10805 [Coleophoma crateriformis]|uniref:Nephrocystin 3-like N-terminal domain-containing protein n=1 Tax=Coleophoma crateriformis TaxID=565419 RepID=A0A3D8QL11_9HELO|nr:hypothetical protein BP5796_10805 [Coleophoma crateriformis]